MVKQSGFSLIEIMIAVAIVAILAAIAIPSYERYKIKVNRVAAQSELVEMGSVLQQYLITHRTYAKNATSFISLDDLKLTTQLPSHETPKLYDVVLTATASTWQLTASPIANTRQANNGILILNSKGYRCWDEDNSGGCDANAASNWDGR